MPDNWPLLTTAFVPCVNVFTSYWKLDLKFGVQLASTLGLALWNLASWNAA